MRPPPLPTDVEVFDEVSAELETSADDIVVVPQVDVDGRAVDTVDRIKLGADIIRRLVGVGL